MPRVSFFQLLGKGDIKKKMGRHRFAQIIIYIALGFFLRFVIVAKILENSEIWWLQTAVIILVFTIGIGYVFRGTAKVIEETTDVLKERTKLAGGFLQSLGTAFPDMVIGIVAAFLSLQSKNTDYVRSINLAIIAASTTFGSNIYNILHATWCIYRQNVANIEKAAVAMFPPFKFGGALIPFSQHHIKPSVREMDEAVRVLTVLTMLTTFSAVSMVLFGRVRGFEEVIAGDLYQLIQPVGLILLIICIVVLYYFRKSHRPETPIKEILEGENYYSRQPSWVIWSALILSGIAILFTAESMVKTMEVFSRLTRIPFVVMGILAALIGCFGEMLVVHNFSVHPKGRIGDAVVGVAMDNIVTTLGASIVAVMGGIFLGGNSLILIFITILAANTLLIEQISKLKNDL